MSETRVIAVNPGRFTPEETAAVVESLRAGGAAAVPTDALYALVARLDLPEAAARLKDAGSVARLLASRDDLRTLSPSALRLIRRFWPGPLTVVLGDQAFRCPNDPVAKDLLRRAGAPLGAVELADVGAGKADVRLDAGPTRQKSPSTVVRIGGARAELLREGAIPRSMIEEADLFTILFVCTGNTCRSPMAEALMRKLLADRLNVREDELAAKGYRVISAGTGAQAGGAATEEAEIAVRAYGADLSRHASRPVSMTLVEEADRVYVMTPRHKRDLEEWMPEQAAKIQPLDPRGAAVEDPIGGDASVYKASAKRIRDALQERLKDIP
ncbi:MAG TPA: Sua5/YciO/YrdC/YwlC family protein [Planctomycetota bacterium]